jgi:2-polyprenyl-3-methyl-5-hydroxy-6-metoxy-1,4-benzoquinol methylase
MSDTNRFIENGRKFYEMMDAGKNDYWKHMPGPRHRRANVINFIRQVSPQSIGDFGCGNGSLLKEIQNQFSDIQLIGFDLSKSQTTVNQKQYPNMTWTFCDLSSSDFKVKKLVDLAVSSEVIEHIDLHELYLKNVYNCIRSGGYLFLSTQSGRI